MLGIIGICSLCIVGCLAITGDLSSAWSIVRFAVESEYIEATEFDSHVGGMKLSELEGKTASQIDEMYAPVLSKYGADGKVTGQYFFETKDYIFSTKWDPYLDLEKCPQYLIYVEYDDTEAFTGIQKIQSFADEYVRANMDCIDYREYIINN